MKNTPNEYRPLIGLEIHVELKTESKMFCQCSAEYFGRRPNTNTCPVCLGLPGALPVPNKTAVEWTMKIGKALNCTINTVTKFDRKHYFYPDLPKGYQISQYDEPIAVNGHIDIPSSVIPAKAGIQDSIKRFRIHRVHLEEDTGKLTHASGESLVDFNRSSVPLVEIVTEADFDNSDDVKRFLEELHTIVRYLDVSDVDMDRGSMRMEPNISVRVLKDVIPAKAGIQGNIPGDPGFEYPPYKVEVKNINSFNFVKKAIEYEIVRQTEILEKGEIPPQETRGYNEDKGVTVSQRVKEEAADYRYFPEPDIPPMVFEQEYIDSIAVTELPAQKMARYVTDLNIREQDAMNMTRDRVTAEYFEEVMTHVKDLTAQQIANLIVNHKLSMELDADEFAIRAAEVLAPRVTDTVALEAAITKVLAASEKAVADYRSGRETAIMYLVGQVMREMRGTADASDVKQALITALK